jgi:hypothetical protein
MRLGAAPSPYYSNDYSSSKTDLSEANANTGRGKRHIESCHLLEHSALWSVCELRCWLAICYMLVSCSQLIFYLEGYVPPKHRLTYGPRGATSHKMAAHLPL